MKLTKSLVRRGGATATTWTRERGSTVKVVPFSEGYTDYKKGIIITTSIPSKGGGVTEVEIISSSEVFGSIVEAMMRADQKSTTEAFARAVLTVAKN
ncbi:hypothetical protein RAC92_20635 [Agrobacterium sp. CR_3]|uniref:hypothetical protein n=1 Tax=unclassified Agrobacterium TaxID=2632611 RepID=UPI0035BF0B27